ncbi:hypothetical protein FO488_00260 [Geobacter sp. FeAm09]|uniref:hypothetical protein n=1 Tax=Geobacter sp. FeAm09 TaxID=2597769 RepID=UPI0011EF4713|nr:hypothetical protein [Geobacter sp. FeAm09]QEM66739.1 hypothetical protein FO488_00260 [Geobacter sp. FeAm09]
MSFSSSSSKDPYVYRYDGFESLWKQRSNDKVLRGRRSTGDESYRHDQVREAHSSIAEGSAVFRLSFWLNLEIAKSQVNYLHRQGSVIQRIKADHPVLGHFQRGEDQHLPGKADLYWATMAINEENPDWSPIGIPHDDIEVLLPDNTWLPMGQAGGFRDTEPGWEIFSDGGKNLLQIKQGQSNDGDCWVFIRQRSGLGGSAYNDSTMLTSPIETFVKAHALLPDRCRWGYALEMPDCVLAFEFFPRFMQRKRACLAGIADRLFKIDRGWEVKVGGDFTSLDQATTSNLYSGLGCAHLLIRGGNWTCFPDAK